MTVKSKSFLLLLFSVLIYAILKALITTEILSEYFEQVLLYTIIVIIVSLGLNLIYGYTGQFSLGHAAFYGIGAYTSALLCRIFNIENAFAYIPVIVFSGVFAGFIGYIIGIPILRLKDDFLAIATLGFGVLVRVFLDNSDRISDTLGGSRGFIGIPKITNLEIVFFSAIVLILLTKNLINSRYGLYLKTIKSDELATTSLGIDTSKMKLLAFTIGCFLAGIGGSLYAHLYTFLHPSNFDILKSIDFLVIVIIGGMGSISGTVIASVLWVGLIEGLRNFLPTEWMDLRWVIIPILLIIIMMLKPEGLFVKKTVR
ncbi:MAG: branched-chain amino acid ABC transporter permease [bacterium]